MVETRKDKDDEKAMTKEEQEAKARAELNANDIETLPPPKHRAD